MMDEEICKTMNITDEETYKRFFPGGAKPLQYQHLFHFPQQQPLETSEQMGQQPTKRKLSDLYGGTAGSSENTSPSRGKQFVVDASNIDEYLKTVPRHPPRPLPQRRSQRQNKFNSRYGLDFPGVSPFPPELMRYLVPPKGTISESERQEAMERMKNTRKATSPFDGFGFSAKEIAALEASKASGKAPCNNPPKLTSKDIPQSVEKYIEEGLDREAVELAVPVYLNNPTKIKEFVNGFTALRELGYSKSQAGEALITCDRDLNRALARLNK